MRAAASMNIKATRDIADAAGYFVDRYKHAFGSSPFKKVLGLIGNPDHADDLAAMAATLRAAAENLALLANVMEPELNSATAAKPEPRR
jgi:hypothetical protein